MNRGRPSKGNPLPTRMREGLAVRDNRQCRRCGVAATEVHHRRSRRVRDAHTHCYCVCVYLCSACHRYATVELDAAREAGLVISVHQAQPWAVPMLTFEGWMYFQCDGSIRYGMS